MSHQARGTDATNKCHPFPRTGSSEWLPRILSLPEWLPLKPQLIYDFWIQWPERGPQWERDWMEPLPSQKNGLRGSVLCHTACASTSFYGMERGVLFTVTVCSVATPAPTIAVPYILCGPFVSPVSPERQGQISHMARSTQHPPWVFWGRTHIIWALGVQVYLK